MVTLPLWMSKIATLVQLINFRVHFPLHPQTLPHTPVSQTQHLVFPTVLRLCCS